MATDFDAIIIGSGAGGAPIAHTLINSGKNVLILEKGPLLLNQYQSPNGSSVAKRDEMLSTGPEKILDIPDGQLGKHPLTGKSYNKIPYYSSHVEPDLNDEPHIYIDADNQRRATIEGYTAQVVGGGTQLYGGVSLRFTEEDFQLASFNKNRNFSNGSKKQVVIDNARDWPITYKDMEKYYTKAEKLTGINGTKENQQKQFISGQDSYQKPLDPNPISHVIELGMDALGMPKYRTPLAVITEDHAPSGRKAGNPKTSYVNRYLDPMGYKSSTWVSLLYPIRDKAGFNLWPNCIVTHLEAQGDKVTVVHYLDPGGQPKTVKAGIVVVACSAIETVRLLMLSAEKDPDFKKRIDFNNLLGKYFLTHCFGGAQVRLKERFDKSVSLDSDWATDFCNTKEWIIQNDVWAGGTLYNNTSDQALPLAIARTTDNQDLDNIWRGFLEYRADKIGDEMLGYFYDLNYGRLLSMTFMANQLPLVTNKITLDPFVKDKWGRPVALIEKRWHEVDQDLGQKLSNACREVLFTGVKKLWPSYADEILKNSQEHPDDANYEAFISSGNVNDVARIANHILGGARFGTDENDSVLDSSCKAWRFQNLYITDGACMPTSGSGNPTLTIQANAFRIADILLNEGRV